MFCQVDGESFVARKYHRHFYIIDQTIDQLQSERRMCQRVRTLITGERVSVINMKEPSIISSNLNLLFLEGQRYMLALEMLKSV